MIKPVVANWKMNFSLTDAINFCKNLSLSLENSDYTKEYSNIPIIASPSLYLSYLSQNFPNLTFAAQDVTSHHENYGEFTGEISAKMLTHLRIKYVIIGHSYRRMHHLESNDAIKRKAENCINNNIIPILCIGEPLEIRKELRHLDYIEKQIKESLPNASDLILAYEPVWSIGTGNIPTIYELEEVFGFIENIIAKPTTLVYGGSVNLTNITLLKNVKQIEGLLLGKSSLNIAEFKQIIENW